MKCVSITNVGERGSNEDAFYDGGVLFIVCDGVGGNVYGEVASKLACASLSDYFQDNAVSVYSNSYLNDALKYTIQKFEEIECKYPETKGMATTVALVTFNGAGANVAWLGDSRLYHIRKKEILFVTEDHSLINELAKQGRDVAGIQRNFITKSLSSKTSGEFSLHRIDAALIEKSDFFFVCTDGVLENVSNEILCVALTSENTLEENAQKIFSLCEGKTKDNFTFMIVEM